jgi:hypothetical protein
MEASMTLFDWDYVVENAKPTPMSLYETTMAAYRGPTTTTIQALVCDLSQVASESPNAMWRKMARFILLLVTLKLAQRSEPEGDHEELVEGIRTSWDAFLESSTPTCQPRRSTRRQVDSTKKKQINTEVELL